MQKHGPSDRVIAWLAFGAFVGALASWVGFGVTERLWFAVAAVGAMMLASGSYAVYLDGHLRRVTRILSNRQARS